MKILFSLSEIGASNSLNLICYLIFVNKDISITTLDITLKCCMTVLHNYSEGSVSQIFNLSSSFYFM